MKSFEILEDVNNNKNSVNDGCINLRLFDAYTTKKPSLIVCSIYIGTICNNKLNTVFILLLES